MIPRRIVRQLELRELVLTFNIFIPRVPYVDLLFPRGGKPVGRVLLVPSSYFRALRRTAVRPPRLAAPPLPSPPLGRASLAAPPHTLSLTPLRTLRPPLSALRLAQPAPRLCAKVCAFLPCAQLLHQCPST